MRAEGFMEHLLGLAPLGPGSAILLETASVHAFGLRRSFRAVGLNDDHIVIGVETVRPWRMASFRGARYVAELPLDVPPPPIGSRIEVRRV